MANISIDNPITNELKRKYVHLLSFAIPLWYIISPSTIIVFTSIVLFLVLLIDLSRLFTDNYISYYFNYYLADTTRDYENKQLLSATVLIISFFFVILLFESSIAIYSITFACISDAAAAIFGIKFGKISNYLNKTFEGSLAFLLSSIIIICIYLPILKIEIDIIYLIFCIVIITVIESITPTKYDNISVPISSAIIISAFSML